MQSQSCKVYQKPRPGQHGRPSCPFELYEYSRWLGNGPAEYALVQGTSCIRKTSTWRTVTGIRTPWSFHRADIPRLRAMRPVRTDIGVHFAGGSAADVDASWVAESDEPECIRRNDAKEGNFRPTLNMSGEEGVVVPCWGQTPLGICLEIIICTKKLFF